MMDIENIFDYDVVIVGNSAEGLFLAHSLPKRIKALIISKEMADVNNKVLSKSELEACSLKGDLTSDELKFNGADRIIERLGEYGINIPMETAMASDTVKFDISIADIKESLYKKIDEKNNIDIWEGSEVIDIITDDDDEACRGVTVLKDGEITVVYSRDTVFATGSNFYLVNAKARASYINADIPAILIRHGVDIEFDFDKEPKEALTKKNTRYVPGRIVTDSYGATSMRHFYAVNWSIENIVAGQFFKCLSMAEVTAFRINEKFNAIDGKRPNVKIHNYDDLATWYIENCHLMSDKIKSENIEFYKEWC